MMKKTCFLFLLLLCGVVAIAQDFEIVSVESLPADMSAREEMKTDHNDRQCALLRIATQNIAPNQRESFSFVPDLGSEVVERATRDGEIWLWVSPGLKYLRVKHRDWGQYELRLQDYVTRVEALHTYKITIKGMLTLPLQEQESKVPTQQYLAFSISPTNATLFVNDELWEVGSDGSAVRFVNFGTYNYRVMAPNYLPETGSVTVNDPDNTQTVSVSLKPDFVEVTLKVDADAEIWVNNEKKGTRTWTGNLGKGNYKIECKQAGHETSMIAKEITADMKGQVIDLPKPTPLYGSLNIESTPNFATIYIDGEMVGETPKFVKEIMVGEHELKLKKDYYSEHIETFTITKDEHKQVKVMMKKKDDVQQPIATTTNMFDDQIFTVNGISFTMKFVEGGTFTMGCTFEQDEECDDNEKPAHIVTLSDYYIGEFEVTQALWETVMGTKLSDFKGDNLPVSSVLWDECWLFITKLNQLTGQNFRLPTEAEWEYAARGGNKTKGFRYSGSDNIEEIAWYYYNSEDKPHIVGTKLPNELGIYDMSGNVWEWCQDGYGRYSSDSQINPTGPSKPIYRVLRGGSWHFNARCNRVSYRSDNNPYGRNPYEGFRLCLSK